MNRAHPTSWIAALLLTACGPMGLVGEEWVGDEPLGDSSEGGATLAPFITNGKVDQGHPSVGILSSGGAGCTATLVGKRTVLTAGHCLKGSSATFKLSGSSYLSVRATRHPGYGGGNRNDVAVVILGQDVPGATPSPIATVAPRVGQPITLVGYGKTGEQSNDFGTKRVATNVISQVAPTTFSFKGSSNVCNGDSGGPTFVQAGGEEVVAGVHSTKAGFCGYGGTDMRVDAFRQWLTQVAGGDLRIQGGQPPPTQPPPTQPPPTQPPPSSAATEGQSCASKPCAQSLGCVTVFNGTQVYGKFCMEKCSSPGRADPACDGGERCTLSRTAGAVCFNPLTPQSGFTSPGQGGSQPPAPPAPPPGGNGGGACGSADESSVFQLLNQTRAQQGLTPLACDTLGTKAARAHSQDMCNRGYFSHYSPEGLAPWDRLKQAGASFSSAGENIAMGYQTPQSVHNGWMSSAGHRTNMLSPGWTRVGIGLVRCNGTRPYWTEVFMR